MANTITQDNNSINNNANDTSSDANSVDDNVNGNSLDANNVNDNIDSSTVASENDVRTEYGGYYKSQHAQQDSQKFFGVQAEKAILR